MPKPVSHVVKRPGRKLGDPEYVIPVPEELATVPGIPQRSEDVSFYSRVYPLETQNIEKAADREWVWTVYSEEISKYREKHDIINKPLVDASLTTGNIEPYAEPDDKAGDLTEVIRQKGRELGFGEVGYTQFDLRYAYASKKGWVKYQHVICLALEQDYYQTQTIPSLEAEFAHFGTYEIEGALALDLADFIRSLGYHAQVHSPNDNSAAYIPMFVQAGLGQLGANGQLLSPHFGSRARLALITTDAPVTYDDPIDYGIHKFCEQCQVCVNRCPGRALVRDKVWWRGAEKHKLIYDRCRPVMARYEGCAVCMKTCPIQRYGMKPVMEHYIETGQVLGKGTDNLEGFELSDKGYFGPGQLPTFNRQFFEIPHGTKEEWLFEQFKEKLEEEGVPPAEQLVDFAYQIHEILSSGKSTRGDE